MRGISDFIHINERLKTPFVQVFNDVLTRKNTVPPPIDEPVDSSIESSLSDQWHSGSLDDLLAHYFLDDVQWDHPLVAQFADEFITRVPSQSDVSNSLLAIHRQIQSFFKDSKLHARSLVHFELAIMMYIQHKHGIKWPDIHAYDARSVFNDSAFGMMWLDKKGWQHMALLDDTIQSFCMDNFLSIELVGRSSRTLYPNGNRKPQDLQVIDMNHDQVSLLVQTLFQDGFDGHSTQSIVDTIRGHMQEYNYITDHCHEWQDLDTIFMKNGGDCEDLAHLEASLLLRAFSDAGFDELLPTVELVTGTIGQGSNRIGHTVIQFEMNQKRYIIDSTSREGAILDSIYKSFYGFESSLTYGLNATNDTLRIARGIDTRAINTVAGVASEVSSYSGGITQFEEDFLAELDIIVYNTDSFGQEHPSQGIATNYKDKAIAYHDQLTNPDTNSSFWKDSTTPTEEAANQLAALDNYPYEAIDAGDDLMVGTNTKSYDFETGLAGYIEVPYNRLSDMSLNLTSELMNKYVGQTYNGYFIYDYARLMSDYQTVLNSIQQTTCYISAIMAYANAFNWIGSQVSYDSDSNPEIKNRQRFIKNVQNALLKMVDEVDYFISLFTTTYDDLNSATYSTMMQEVTQHYQTVEKGIKDVFELGSQTIERNILTERLELEYWYINARNRQQVMQASFDMPNSNVLGAFVNFSDPYSDILSDSNGSPNNFAVQQSQMELDIENGVLKPVTVNPAGSLPTTVYIDPVHYYFAYYFKNETIDLYDNALGDSPSSVQPNLLLDDEAIYNLLKPQYDLLDLDAMTVGFGGFGYSTPDWVTNIGANSTGANFNYFQDSNTTACTVDENNYKQTNLYKYFHSKAMVFHERFENEAYNSGMGETNSQENVYGYEADSSTLGTWVDKIPQSRLEYKGRKKRLNPFDVTDILEFNSDGSLVSASKTSTDFWQDLKSNNYIDEYGRFTDKLLKKMFVRTSGVLNNADTLIGNMGLNNDYTNFQESLGERLYKMVDYDAEEYGKTEFDYTQPVVYSRTTKAQKINGYTDPFGNESVDEFQFLRDYFNDGPSPNMQSAMQASLDVASSESEKVTDISPNFSTTNKNVTNWSAISSKTVSLNGTSYQVGAVKDYLNANVTNGANFYTDLTVTATQQEAYYDKIMGTKDLDKIPSGYKDYAGAYVTIDGSKWECVDLVNLPAGSQAAKDALEKSNAGEDFSYTPDLSSVSVGESIQNVAGSQPLVLPSSSPSYSYDYGKMNRLPFDNRIITETTESRYTDQGPTILGSINFVDKSQASLTFDSSHSSNIDLIQNYNGLFTQETSATRDLIRDKNSLEKEMTPVHSYNDESVVFTSTDVKSLMGWSGAEEDFYTLMLRLEEEGFVEFVFQREYSGRSATAEGLGLYTLMGFTLKSSFLAAPSFSNLGGAGQLSSSQVATYSSNFQNNAKSTLISRWQSASKSEMLDFVYRGRDYTESDFLDGKAPQLIHFNGQKTDGPILEMEERMPFMTYDWQTLKTAHNGMISMQNRMRLFYFVAQAYVSSYQSIAKSIDPVAFSGTASMEADLQILEKRIGKQTEQLAQVNTKTAQFVEINNQYYKQKLNSIKASDVAIRIGKGMKLYGDLAAIVPYLISTGFYKASYAAGGPTNPVGGPLYGTGFSFQVAAIICLVLGMVGQLMELAVKMAHEYGLPQMLDEDLITEGDRADFKELSYYKSPTTFGNGGTWVNDFSYSGELVGIYNTYSPFKNSDYSYVNESLGRDEWLSPTQLTTDKQGDCEDYAVLAASAALKTGISQDKLRVVNGLVGWGGPLPTSHTVLLYDPTGQFAVADATYPVGHVNDDGTGTVKTGRQNFTNQAGIQVIDLTTEWDNDNDTYYTLGNYQNKHGYFQPLYSYDEPGGNANTGYGYYDYEIFSYEASGTLPLPTVPSGPQNLTATDGKHRYEFDQNSSRKLKVKIYDLETGALVEEREESKKIEFGIESYKIVDPQGVQQELNLSENKSNNSGGSSADEASLSSDATNQGGFSAPSVKYSDFEESSTETSVPYATQSVIASRVGRGSSAGVSADVVTNQMQNLLTLEMEEHAILNEMFTLAVNPRNMSTANRYDDNGDQIVYAVYDSPTLQALQRRMFIVQTKMKKNFLVMKLRAEFFSLIGVRLGDIDRQQMSSAMDSIFSSHFAQINDSVEKLQQLMTSMQSLNHSNYDIYDARESSVWAFAFQTPMNIIAGLIPAVPEEGPLVYAIAAPFISLLQRVITFFGNEYNAYYFKSVETIREDTSLSGANNLGSIDSLYNSNPNYNSSYSVLSNSPIFEVSADGKIPHKKSVLGDKSKWATMNELGVNGGYELTVSDIEDYYWNTYEGGYYSPTLEDVYKGQIRDYDGNVRAANWQSESIEDYMLKRLSTRFFEDSGNKLLFLNAHIYATAGTKLFSDSSFFNWLQGRLSAEMMHQIRFSMITASYKSLTANLGYTATGGNDAIQMSTSLTGDIGTHYFQLQTTLSMWEQSQIEINQRRFVKFKELDQMLLEFIIAVGSAALSVLGQFSSIGANAAKTIGELMTKVATAVTLTFMNLVSQITNIIYLAIDAEEENTLKEGLDARMAEENDTELEGQDDRNLTASERAQKRLMNERRQVGNESLKTAGNTSTGFASTYVDQSVKIKMKRKVQELFKVLEVQQTLSESVSEHIKQLSSSLGYSTSQAGVGGALGRIQGLAKQAEDKSDQEKFSILQATAARENELHQATKGLLMAVATTVVQFVAKSVTANQKRGPGAASRNQASRMDLGMKIFEEIATGLFSNLVMLSFQSDAEEMKGDRDDRKAENKEGKTKEVDAIGDSSSSRGSQRLSGLEKRALNAELNNASVQEMAQINNALSQFVQELAQGWADLIEKTMKLVASEINKKLRKMIESTEDGNDLFKMMKDMKKSLLGESDAEGSAETPTSDAVESTPTPTEASSADAATAKADAANDQKADSEAASKDPANTPPPPTTAETPKTNSDSASDAGKPGEEAKSNEAAADEKSADKEADKKIDEAKEAEEKSVEKVIKDYKNGNKVDLSKLSMNDLNGLAGRNIPAALKMKVIGEQVAKMTGFRMGMNALKDFRAADTNTEKAMAGLKFGAAILMMVTSPLMGGIYRKAQEDYAGKSPAEEANQKKEHAIAMAIFAEKQGSGDNDSRQKRQAFLTENAGMVASVLSKMSGLEQSKELKSGSISVASELVKTMIRSNIPSGENDATPIGALVIGSLPGSATANMENVLDAFTETDDMGNSSTDSERVMDFLDQVKGVTGGKLLVKEMLNPVNEDRQTVLKSVMGQKNSGRQAISERMQNLLSNPESAAKIAINQSEGLTDPGERLNHLMAFSETFLTKELKNIKNNAGSKSLEDKKNIASSMVALFSAGADAQMATGKPSSMNYLNAGERGAIVEVLQEIKSQDASDLGDGGEEIIKNALEERLQGASGAQEKLAIGELAGLLGVKLNPVPTVSAPQNVTPSAPQGPSDREKAFESLMQDTDTRLDDKLSQMSDSADKPTAKSSAPAPKPISIETNLPQLRSEKRSAQTNEKTATSEKIKADKVHGKALRAEEKADTKLKTASAALDTHNSGEGAIESNVQKFSQSMQDRKNKIAALKTGDGKLTALLDEKNDAVNDQKKIVDNLKGSVKEKERVLKDLGGFKPTVSLMLEKTVVEKRMSEKQNKQEKFLKQLDGIGLVAEEREKAMGSIAEKINTSTKQIDANKEAIATLTNSVDPKQVSKAFRDMFIEKVIENNMQILSGSNSQEKTDALRKHLKKSETAFGASQDAKYLAPLKKMGITMLDTDKAFKETREEQESFRKSSKNIPNQIATLKKQNIALTKSLEADNAGFALLSTEKNKDQRLKTFINNELKGLETGIGNDLDRHNELTTMISEASKQNKMIRNLKEEIGQDRAGLGQEQNKLTMLEGDRNDVEQRIGTDADDRMKKIAEEEMGLQGDRKNLSKAKKELETFNKRREELANNVSDAQAIKDAASKNVKKTKEQADEATGKMLDAKKDTARLRDEITAEKKRVQDEEKRLTEIGAQSLAPVASSTSAQSGSNDPNQSNESQATVTISAPGPTSPNLTGEGSSEDTMSTDKLSSIEGPQTGDDRVGTDSSTGVVKTDFSNQDKAAAALLSSIAEYSGLSSDQARTPVDEDLVRKDDQIQIDQPDEIVKRIFQSLDDSTNSAESAGMVRDFLSSAGVTFGDKGNITDIEQNPRMLLSLLKENHQNVQNFILPIEDGSHRTTLADGTTKPEVPESIKRLTQVALRGVGVEMAFPVQTSQIDPNSKVGDNTAPSGGAIKGVGNVDSNPDAVNKQTGGILPDVLDQNPGEVTRIETDGQNPETQANNDPETKTSSLYETAKTFISGLFRSSPNELNGTDATDQASHDLADLQNDMKKIQTDKKSALDTLDSVKERTTELEKDSEKASAKTKQEQNAINDLSKKLMSQEQELGSLNAQADNLRNPTGSDTEGVQNSSEPVSHKTMASPGASSAPISTTLDNVNKKAQTLQNNVDKTRQELLEKKLEISGGLKEYKELQTTKMNAENKIKLLDAKAALVAQKMDSIKTNGAMMVASKLLDQINDATRNGEKELTNDESQKIATAMHQAMNDGLSSHSIMLVFDFIKEGGPSKQLDLQTQTVDRPVSRQLMTDLIKISAGKDRKNPDAKAAQGIATFIRSNPSFLNQVATVSNDGFIMPAALKNIVAVKSSSVESRDQKVVDSAREHVMNVTQSNSPTSKDLVSAIQDTKMLCRAGIKALMAQLPTGDIHHEKQIQKDINALKESVMLVEQFQHQKHQDDVGAKITLLTVLNHPGVTDTFIFNGMHDTQKLQDSLKQDFSNFDKMIEGANTETLTANIAELATLPKDKFNDIVDGRNVAVATFVKDNWGSLKSPQKVAVAAQFLEQITGVKEGDSDPAGMTLPSEISMTFEEALGKNLMMLVATDQLSLSQVEQLENAEKRVSVSQSELDSSVYLTSNMKQAKALAIIKTGDTNLIAGALHSGGDIDTLSPNELKAVIENAPRSALRLLFSHSQFKTLLENKSYNGQKVLDYQSKRKGPEQDIKNAKTMTPLGDRINFFGTPQASAIQKRDQANQELLRLSQEYDADIECQNYELQKAVASRISADIELGEVLFERPKFNDDPEGFYEVSRKVSRQVFDLLSSSSQQAVIGRMPDQEVVQFFELGAILPMSFAAPELPTDEEDGSIHDTISLEQTQFSTGDLRLLVTIAKAKPNVMTRILNPELFDFDRFSQTVTNASPQKMNVLRSFIQTISPENIALISSDSVLHSSDGADTFALKKLIRQENPVGYMTTVLSAIRQSPEQAVSVLLSAYDVPDPVTESAAVNAFKSIGKAGNLNPELMAQLMSELSDGNLSANEDASNRLDGFLSALGASSDTGDSRADFLKSAMAGAMFLNSSFSFHTKLSAMPTIISDAFDEFKNRMLSGEAVLPPLLPVDESDSTVSPLTQDSITVKRTSFNSAFKKEFISQLDRQDKRRFLGLLIGVQPAQLMHSTDTTVITNQMIPYLLEQPQNADSLKTMVDLMYEADSTVKPAKPQKGQWISNFNILTLSKEEYDYSKKLIQMQETSQLWESLSSQVSLFNSLNNPDIQPNMAMLAHFDPQCIPATQKGLDKIVTYINHFPKKGSPEIDCFKGALAVRGSIIAIQLGDIKNTNTHCSSFLNGYKLMSEKGFFWDDPSKSITSVSGNINKKRVKAILKDINYQIKLGVASYQPKSYQFRGLEDAFDESFESKSFNVNAFIDDPSIPFQSIKQARMFLTQFMNELEMENSVITEKTEKTEFDDARQNKLIHAFQRLKGIEQEYPRLMSSDVTKGLKKMASFAVSKCASNKEAMDMVFNEASASAQQLMRSDMSPDMVNEYVMAGAVNRCRDIIQGPSQGMTSPQLIDKAQLDFKAIVETELGLFKTPNEKEAFVHQVIVKSVQSMGTPVQNAMTLARLRGLQQAIESQKPDAISDKDALLSLLRGNVQATLLSSTVPLSDRSIDHIIHFLKDENAEVATDFFNTLSQKVSPKDFKRIHHRVAMHYRANPLPSSYPAKLARVISDVSQKINLDIPYVVKKEAARLEACSPSELPNTLSEMMANPEFSRHDRAQILSEVIVMNPKVFRNAIRTLNTLTASTKPIKAGKSLPGSTVPELPTESNMPDLPVDSTDISSTKTEGEKVTELITDLLDEVSKDPSREALFEQVYNGAYTGFFEGGVFDRFDEKWLMDHPNAFRTFAVAAGIYGVSKALVGLGLYPLSLFGSGIRQVAGLVTSKPVLDFIHIRHFDSNPLKQALQHVATKSDPNKVGEILARLDKFSFIETVCDLDQERLINLSASSPSFYNQLLKTSLSTRDFFDAKYRNSPTATLNRKVVDMLKVMTEELLSINNDDDKENLSEMIFTALAFKPETQSATYLDGLYQGVAYPLIASSAIAVNMFRGITGLNLGQMSSVSTLDFHRDIFKRNHLKKEMLKTVCDSLRQNPQHMAEFLEYTMSTPESDDQKKAICFELLTAPSMQMNVNQDLLPHLTNTDLVAMALNDPIASVSSMLPDSEKMIFNKQAAFNMLTSDSTQDQSKMISGLLTAINENYISNSDLSSIVQELGQDGLKQLIQTHLDFDTSDSDQYSRLDSQLSELSKSRGTPDLVLLLPKMMGAYAKRYDPGSDTEGLNTREDVLKSVLNTISETQKKTVQPSAPPLPQETKGLDVDSTGTGSQYISTNEDQMSLKFDTLKKDIVVSMKNYMTLSDQDHPGVDVDDSFEPSSEFATLLRDHLNLILKPDSDDNSLFHLSVRDQKIASLYEDLKSFSSNPEETSLVSISPKSTLKKLFEKHNLNPEDVSFIFYRPGENIEHFYSRYDALMHTPIRNVTYKGSIVHRDMKSNITKARDAVENGAYSSIDQFFSEMNYIMEKYDVARFSSIK